MRWKENGTGSKEEEGQFVDGIGNIEGPVVIHVARIVARGCRGPPTFNVPIFTANLPFLNQL